MPENSQAPYVAGNTCYHFACWNGDFEIVQLLLEHPKHNSEDTKIKNLGIQNSEGDTALHYATRNGHLEIVEYLLNNGANHTIKNNKEETPIDCLLKKHGSQELLNLAIQKNLPKLAELLKKIIKGNILYSIFQDYDRNKNQLTDDEYLIGEYTESTFEKNRNLFVQKDLTCPITHWLLLEPVRLISAADESKSQHAFEDSHIQEWFKTSLTNPLNREPVKEGVVPDERVKQRIGEKLLECFNKDLETLEAEEKEKINDAINSILLIEAVKEGNLSQVKQCLDNGIDVNSKGRDGNTLLHIAVEKGHLEIVRALLDQGAYVDAKGDTGAKLLFLAAEKGHSEIVRMLLDQGADVDVTNKNGCTPLYFASQDGYLEVVKELLNHNADVNIKNKNGWTPLSVSSQCGYLEVVKELLEHKANVNGQGKNGYTPLFVASQDGHLEVVKELLNRDADVNVVSNDSWTPLFVAIQNGNLEIVKLLIEKGAYTNIINNHGKTPLDIAKKGDNTEIVTLLEKAQQTSANPESALRRTKIRKPKHFSKCAIQ